jgi:hypothetical protein
MSNCSTNYVCTPVWYDVTANSDTGGKDVIAYASGPHSVDLNMTCVVKTGEVQIQVKDELGVWFTPTEASYTIQDSNVVRIPRANMPDMRFIATADATFSVEGVL